VNSDEELPEGWAATTIGEVAPASKEKVEPHEQPQAPYLSLEHVESNTLRIIGRGSATDVKSTKSVFRAGDVLYGKLRPYLNKVAVPTFDGICSTDFIVFPQRPWLSSQYLMWFLSQPYIVEYADHQSAGVSLPRVKLEALAPIELPLPPLAEQQRIVAKVEELLSQVNATRERLAHTTALLRRFRQSVLAAACDGRLTADSRNSKSEWRTRPLADLAERVTKGTTPTSYGYSFQPSGTNFVKIENLRDGRIDRDSIRAFITDEVHRLQSRSILHAGDILFSIAGTIGQTAIVTAEDLPANTNQALAVIRGTTKYLEPGYLTLVLASRVAQRVADERSRGAGMNNISLADVRFLQIPVPPKVEQREIVRRVGALFALADAIESRVAAATARAERLTQSILAKAFRGELVPTEAELARREGRDYEPASVLLERIRALTPIPSLRSARGQAPRGRGPQRAERGRSRHGGAGGQRRRKAQ
jgi:type I restriction enzyme S subunit